MAHFHTLRERVHSCGSIGELRAWLHRHPYTTGCDAILKFARTYLRSEHPVLEGAAITCRATDLPTATTDDTGAHVGLHIDNWYRSKLNERASAPNRISINLGVTARFLLYINLPLATIGALATEQFAFDTRVGDTRNGLRQLFMSRCGSYPVVRVRLDPGEGYIAPTENMIHFPSAVGCGRVTPRRTSYDASRANASVRRMAWRLSTCWQSTTSPPAGLDCLADAGDDVHVRFVFVIPRFDRFAAGW
jgi:hypothetical protein